MPTGVLHPNQVSVDDAARVLSFLNAAVSAAEIAEMIGLSDGLSAGMRVGEAILDQRTADGPFLFLDQVLDVTGVNLTRFTEIVVALSGARPAAPGASLKIDPSTDSLWLGQGVKITAQITDAEGIGIPDAAATFIVSDGCLTAPAGLQWQKGRAVNLTAETGGIFQFTIDPPFAPPLPYAAQAALESELSRLDRNNSSDRSMNTALLAFAARYRSEGAADLRTAVDRLYEAYPTEPDNVLAGWPIVPISLIGIASGPDGAAQVVTVATLEFRNWLGRWRLALSGEIQNDTRMGDVLSNLNTSAQAGEDVSFSIATVAGAFAGMEQGVLGRLVSEQITGQRVNTFLAGIAPNLGDNAANITKVVGATGTALAGGGTALFEAMRNVQTVDNTTDPTRAKTRELGNRMDTLGTQFNDLSSDALRQSDVGNLRSTISTDVSKGFDTRFAGLTKDIAGLSAGAKGFTTRLNGFDTRFAGLDKTTKGFTTKLNGFDTRLKGKASATQFTNLQKSFSGLKKDAITKTQLTGLENKLRTDFSKNLKVKVNAEIAPHLTKFGAMQKQLNGMATKGQFTNLQKSLATTNQNLAKANQGRVTQQQLSALQNQFSQNMNAQVAQSVNTAMGSVTRQISGLQRSLNTKASNQQVAGLRTSVNNLKSAGSLKQADLNALESRLKTQLGQQINGAVSGVRTDLTRQLNTKASASQFSTLSTQVKNMKKVPAGTTKTVKRTNTNVNLGAAGRIIGNQGIRRF